MAPPAQVGPWAAGTRPGPRPLRVRSERTPCAKGDSQCLLAGRPLRREGVDRPSQLGKDSGEALPMRHGCEDPTRLGERTEGISGAWQSVHRWGPLDSWEGYYLPLSLCVKGKK